MKQGNLVFGHKLFETKTWSKFFFCVRTHLPYSVSSEKAFFIYNRFKITNTKRRNKTKMARQNDKYLKKSRLSFFLEVRRDIKRCHFTLPIRLKKKTRQIKNPFKLKRWLIRKACFMSFKPSWHLHFLLIIFQKVQSWTTIWLTRLWPRAPMYSGIVRLQLIQEIWHIDGQKMINQLMQSNLASGHIHK